MRLSVIIPVHNSEKTIENTVRKILDQVTSFELEILLIENGSTDNTNDVCMKLMTQYKEVMAFNSEIIGPSAARNVGLNHCSGDIIGFCDADDYYEPGVLDYILTIFSQNKNVSMLAGSMQVEKLDGCDWLRKKSLKNEVINRSKELIPRLLCDARMMGSVCNKFYRRKLIEKTRFKEDIFYCEDTYFNIAIVKENSNFVSQTISKNVYKYVKTGDSATNNTKRLFEGNNLKYILTMERIEKDFRLDSEEENALKKACYVMAIDNFYIHDISELQQEKLVKIIREGFEVYKNDLLQYTAIRYLKFLLLGMKIIRKNRTLFKEDY